MRQQQVTPLIRVRWPVMVWRDGLMSSLRPSAQYLMALVIIHDGVTPGGSFMVPMGLN